MHVHLNVGADVDNCVGHFKMHSKLCICAKEIWIMPKQRQRSTNSLKVITNLKMSFTYFECATFKYQQHCFYQMCVILQIVLSNRLKVMKKLG